MVRISCPSTFLAVGHFGRCAKEKKTGRWHLKKQINSTLTEASFFWPLINVALIIQSGRNEDVSFS